MNTLSYVAPKEEPELPCPCCRHLTLAYASLDGWLGDQDGPAWYGREGDARYSEPRSNPAVSNFFGEVETPLWNGWPTVLCARMSLALGREVHDAEV